MKEKKHIDRIFQERLKDFESTPDTKVWDSIQATLNDKKRDRKVIPLWWKIGGVAASLLLILTLGNILLINESSPQKPNEIYTDKTTDENLEKQSIYTEDSLTRITESSKNEESSNIKSSESVENASNQKVANTDAVLTSVKKNEAKSTSNFSNDKSRGEAVVSNENKLNQSSNNKVTERLAENSSEEKQETNNDPINRDSDLIKNTETEKVASVNNSKENINPEGAISEEKNNPETTEEFKDLMAIEDAIAESETTNEKENTPINRWAISPNVAPVYFNSLGKGSPISSQFIDNTKTGEVEMSYGVTGSYAVNNKLKIRLGVNNVNLGYTTQDVIVYDNLSAFVGGSDNGNIAMRQSSTNTTFLSAASIANDNAPNIIVNNVKGSIDQEFGFIEVPLEVEYNLFQDKLGINVIGGFSTFFLNKNEVYSTLSRKRDYVGEATNLNNTSYSANLGLGINYSLSKLLDINLEPIFKYQFNTFTNTSGSFNPYMFGVYSGVRFKF